MKVFFGFPPRICVLTLAVLCLCTISVQAADLVAYYPLDGDAKDKKTKIMGRSKADRNGLMVSLEKPST